MREVFADLFIKITKDKTNAAKYLPITAAPIAPVAPASQDLKDKLTLLQAALDDLQVELYTQVYQSQNP